MTLSQKIHTIFFFTKKGIFMPVDAMTTTNLPVLLLQLSFFSILVSSLINEAIRCTLKYGGVFHNFMVQCFLKSN